jgi:hypothetical protein
MKTFSEFIAEAENASSQIAALRAQARQAMQRGDMEKFKELNVRAGELQAGTQAKISAATSDKPKTSTKPNTYVGGYASKPKDVVSSVGTQANVSRQRVTNLRTGTDLGSASSPGENVHGRYADTRGRSQRGGTTPQRNKGQGRSTPEKGKYGEG